MGHCALAARMTPLRAAAQLHAIRRKQARRVIDSMRISVFALLTLVGADAYSQQPEQDWLIIPGERVGPITAETSDASIDALFGPNNVQRGDVYLGEGFTAAGTVVYPDDAARRVEIVWSDNARTTPKEIRLTGETSAWRTAEGLSLGSTLREIEHLNGFPFKLAGFGFDYGGTVVDCGRGQLMMVGCSGDAARAPTGRLLVMRLRPGASAIAAPEYRQVVGDRVFSSGHPAMQALNPRVYQIIVSIGPSGDAGTLCDGPVSRVRRC